jgi:hypothetical protein
MRSNNDYYVYVIFRPNGVPCYVGKGRGKRSEHHAKFSHNRHLKNIYAQAGGKLPLVKIRDNLTDAEACTLEVAFIAAIGREDLGLGPLVNFCDGGEGVSGLIQTEQKSRRISEKLKGRTFTEEHLRNMILSRMGKKESAATRAKKSATHTGMKKPWVSAHHKGRPNPGVTAAQLGRKSPEHSERMKGNKLSVGKNMGADSGVPRKLTPEIVLAIRQRAASGEKHQDIANDYGIHKSQISLIHMRRTWAWV